MVRDRAIVHINIADFAAGVETCITPALKDTPLIIAPEGAPRARVFDMNEAAFREGVRKDMPLARALRLFPGMPVRPPRPHQYALVMKQMARQAAAFSPLMEAGGTDGHLFLDITGTSRLFGPPPDVAWRLRKTLKKHLGLDPIWTLATSKLVAKTASRIVKPLGEYIVGPGEEAAFLAPLPIGFLPGLFPDECRVLAQFNIDRVSQARALSKTQLALPFGTRAAQIHDLLQGIDPTPVGKPATRTPEIRAELEFAGDTNDADLVRAGLARLAAQICETLRRTGQQAKKLKLTLTYADGGQNTRTGPMDTDSETAMRRAGWDLLCSIWTRRVRVRHLCLICLSCPRTPVQAGLFDSVSRPDKQQRCKTETPGPVLAALDTIRARFGALAVQSGTALPLNAGPAAG